LVGLLGPLQVVGDDGALIGVNGARLRVLLGRLAVDVGRVVPADRLFEDLYGEEPPQSPANALQGLVSKLRRVLGRPGVIANLGGGYTLELEPDAVDLVAFEWLASRGRGAHAAGDSERALTLFDEAMALWRGPALVDFAYEEFAQPTIARMVEARAAMLEDRLDSCLALGRHHALVSELEALVAENPLRERLRGQLMLALYRAGRQAEALRAYQAARAVLNEELGVDPGGDLRRLEAAILAQDASLDIPQPVPSGPVVAARRRTNIGAPLTSLVGRAAELGRLQDLLAGRRLVTLIGPGGAGKTRLAVEAARASMPAFAAGAWIAELAAIGDPSAVAGVIVAALDAADPATAPLTRLVDYLGDKSLLLVLDNCEHVIGEACRVVAELSAPAQTCGCWRPAGRRSGCPGRRCGRPRRSGWLTLSSCFASGRPLPISRSSSTPGRRRPWRRSASASTACRSPSSWPPPVPGPLMSRSSPGASTIASGS
jgi:DNA-binding SARP family transcriptional activator